MTYEKYKKSINSYKYQKGLIFIQRKIGNYYIIFKSNQFKKKYQVFKTQNLHEVKKAYWQIVKGKIDIDDMINASSNDKIDCNSKMTEKMNNYIYTYDDNFVSKYLRSYFRRIYNLEINGEITTVLYAVGLPFKERLKRYVVAYFRHNFTTYDMDGNNEKFNNQAEKRNYFNGLARDKMDELRIY